MKKCETLEFFFPVRTRITNFQYFSLYFFNLSVVRQVKLMPEVNSVRKKACFILLKVSSNFCFSPYKLKNNFQMG